MRLRLPLALLLVAAALGCNLTGPRGSITARARQDGLELTNDTDSRLSYQFFDQGILALYDPAPCQPNCNFPTVDAHAVAVIPWTAAYGYSDTRHSYFVTWRTDDDRTGSAIVERP